MKEISGAEARVAVQEVLAQVVDGLVELGAEPCNEVRAEDYSDVSAALAGRIICIYTCIIQMH